MSRYRSKPFGHLKPGDRITVRTHRSNSTAAGRLLSIDRVDGHYELSLVDKQSREDLAIPTDLIDQARLVRGRQRKKG